MTSTSTALLVLGADDGGEPALIYTWAQVSGPAPVTFVPNGTNLAKSANVTFTSPGSYALQVTLRDSYGLTATSSVTVVVNPAASAITISPASASLAAGGTRQFTATATDQFNVPLAPQPTFGWTVSGGGSISASGSFTAAATPGGPFTVTASAGGRTGTAQVSVTAGTGDVTPPAVALIAPADGALLHGLVRLEASAQDDVAIAKVTFLLDGQALGEASAAPYTLDLDSAGLSEGAHSLGASAVDTSGNSAQSPPIQVTVAAGEAPDGGPPLAAESLSEVQGGCGCAGASGGLLAFGLAALLGLSPRLKRRTARAARPSR